MSTLQQPPILGLPNELLTEILRHAVQLPNWDFAARSDFASYDLKICRRLSFVCKRFYSTCLKFNYQTIRLGPRVDSWRRPPTIASVTHLHNIMRANSVIPGYCQNLSIYSGYPSDDSSEALAYFANNLVPLLTEVDTLDFNGPLSAILGDPSWLVLQQAAQHMPKLAHLELTGHINDLEIFPLVNQVEFRALQTLRLSGASGEHGTLQRPETKKATFDQLSLVNLRVKAHQLEILINWPSMLTTFVFDEFKRSQSHSGQLALPEILQMLRKHKETLKIIKICSMGARVPIEDSLDTSDFTALEELTVSRWHFGDVDPVFQETDVDLVAAPNFKRLTYDARRDMYRQRHGQFKSDDETWVRRLIQGALARNLSLQQFEIICQQNIPATRIDPVYPWDRIKRLQEEFRPRGVGVICNPPVVTKWEWNALHDVLDD
ncbi:unnamed protein product [Clonostachys rosea f. rosea IK726]|uniref:F-box domain-containing protein n=2 Tax=Bionectria ochroleuca TaxID=29856 RepID=A0A0B7JQ66_BIOOC|nr:unnamed protein product [Clonostachys rosea f. rosea IK726]